MERAFGPVVWNKEIVHEMEIFKESGACVVCRRPTRLMCSTCRKEYYCGAEHQQVHRALHKQECFPAKTLQNEFYGRYLVATRDIEPGEMIFTEKALMHCPNVGGQGAPKFLPVCLGCCKVVHTESICSKCVWPLCGKQCPMLIFHEAMECTILSYNNVIPSGKGEEYDFIKIIRILLLKERDRYKWDKITSLESQMERRSKSPQDVCTVFEAIEFIRESCDLKQFDCELVNLVYGICKINSYSSDLHASQNYSFRLESGIYYNTSMMAHDCVPNCRLIVVETKNPQANLTMQVMAAVPIKQGDILAYSYVDNTYPTFQRQQLLQENYFFSCQCKRCLDPSELGTHYSGIKCPKTGCQDGVFVPSCVLDMNAPWQCNSCQFSRSSSDFNIFLAALKEVIDEAATQNNPAASCSKYEKILMENLGVTLSEYHHEMYTIRCHLLVKMLDAALTFPENKALLHHVSQRLIFHSKRCLEVADFFNPGLSITRGYIKNFKSFKLT